MKLKPTVAKIAAVVSSLVLVGGYLLYQSGGTLLPSTKRATVFDPTREPLKPSTRPAQLPAPDPHLFSSSKSMSPIIPAPQPTTQPEP